MNRPRRFAAALFLASALPAIAAADAADSAYWDYRIPKHRWSQWTASFSGAANHFDGSGPGDRQNRSGLFSGLLRTRFTGGYDSDPLFQAWELDAAAGGERRHGEGAAANSIESVTSENRSSDLDQVFEALYRVRAYPWVFPLGLTASTNQLLVLSQRFFSGEVERTYLGYHEFDLSSSSSGSWTYLGDLAVGTGLGRVRDVTPVYEAQVLEERLIRSGALAGPLSRAAMERLAALFTVQDEVGFAHGRPSKYFWEEVERVLVEDGVLVSGAMSLYDAHRVLEPLTIRGRIQRSAGWFFGPAVQLQMYQRHFSDKASNSSRIYRADTLYYSYGSDDSFSDFSRDDRIWTAASAEYHHPAGPDWQFDIQQRTQIAESGKDLISNALASVTWVVTDRWLATAGIRHTIFWEGQGLERGPETWRVQYGAELSYFLEDRWAVTLSAQETQLHSTSVFERGGTYSLGLAYVISGLFEAAGLTGSMRPIPGGR